MNSIKWMSSTEVAQAADITKQRVYVAVNIGDLPAYRIGRHYRFKRREVEEWLERREEVSHRDD